jgi:uncharacterized protein YkwD
MKKTLFGFLFSAIFSLFLFSNLLAQTSPSELEQSLLDEMNKVRTDPKSYIPYLEEYKKLFKGKNVDYPDAMMMTFEGAKAVDDAIKFLQKATKLEPFSFSGGLTKPARLQLTDLMENYSLGHTGKDGSNIPKRIARFGKVGKLGAENVTNHFSTPKDIVMQMIIDDGVKSRLHRKNLFNKVFKQVGIAHGPGPNNDPITVLVFADSFIEN